MRTTGFGLASSMGRIGGIISPFIAVNLVQKCHQASAILPYVGVVLLSGICVLLFPFETKGLELTDSVSSTKRETEAVKHEV